MLLLSDPAQGHCHLIASTNQLSQQPPGNNLLPWCERETLHAGGVLGGRAVGVLDLAGLRESREMVDWL